jgi:hypothetical protein
MTSEARKNSSIGGETPESSDVEESRVLSIGLGCDNAHLPPVEDGEVDKLGPYADPDQMGWDAAKQRKLA